MGTPYVLWDKSKSDCHMRAAWGTRIFEKSLSGSQIFKIGYGKVIVSV